MKYLDNNGTNYLYNKIKESSLINHFGEFVSICVSPDGSDDNDGSQDNPFKTYEKAIDSIKLYSNASEVHIHLAAGTYDITPGYTLTGYPSIVRIYGESTDTTILRSTTNGPSFNFVGLIGLYFIQIQITEPTNQVLYVGWSDFYISNSVLVSAGSKYAGAFVVGGNGQIINTNISNCGTAIYSRYSNTYVTTCTGENNKYAIGCDHGIVITSGTIPTADTNYSIARNGCINPASGVS